MTDSDKTTQVSYSDFYEKIDQGYLYFNKEFPITDKITIYKPSVLDVFNYKKGQPDGGESGFYSIVNIFTGNTTSFKVLLWDNGIDWNNISDFEMWISFIRSLTPNETSLLFGDLNFSLFEPYKTQKEVEVIDETENEDEDNNDNEDSENDEETDVKEKKLKTEIQESIILYDKENDIEITEITYFRIRNYLRHMFNIFPRVEVGIKGKTLKKEIVNYDRMVAERNKRLGVDNDFLFPLVSSLLNHPGFKYKKDELGEVGIVEFMDSVQRLNVYEQSIATLHGMMGGFIDGSKIKPEQYNFMKEINIKPRDYMKEVQEVGKNPWNIHYD